ncbi:P27 family phage terminase small subunit [Phyllobacterium chamaecytisi]|uniref:P27 family phage terminase small subunit n=1 Tax=Phyllobacterium chamaecytisi TaxID=2876082 RepID=UPI001CCA7CB9|nr:P27 family phage terminase small subunit [Phyllobacterium sp. KW56]MBZ9602899.1 P27 family phage terminase small subunit [Phyllobacterium sp. KW56]
MGGFHGAVNWRRYGRHAFGAVYWRHPPEFTGSVPRNSNRIKRNPLLGIQLHCDRVMAGAGIELGLSPVAHARLARPEHETDQDDAFEAYIFGDTDYINQNYIN